MARASLMFAFALLAVLLAGPAWFDAGVGAQDELVSGSLRAQVRQLEARVAELERRALPDYAPPESEAIGPWTPETLAYAAWEIRPPYATYMVCELRPIRNMIAEVKGQHWTICVRPDAPTSR